MPADAKRKLELKLESDVRPAEQIDVHACRRCSWAVLWWNLLWLLRITPHGGNRNYFFHWVIKIPLATRLMVHVPRKEAVKPSPFFPPLFFDAAFIKMPIYSRHFEIYPILTPRLCIDMVFISCLSLERVETVSKLSTRGHRGWIR